MNDIPLRHMKTNNTEPFELEGFNIWNLSELLSGKDMYHELHRHTFYFILVIENGIGEHSIDFISYPIINNCLFFISPGQVHQLNLSSCSTGYIVQFPENFFSHIDVVTKQMIRKIGAQNYYQPQNFHRILSLIKEISREIIGKMDKYEYNIHLYLQLFFVELLREDLTNHKIEEAINSLYTKEKIELFHEIIANNICAHKQVGWYAKEMNLTPYQLNVLTKKMLGKTSLDVINDYILLEAKRYLLATSNQINQISWHLGYEDVSYFIRFFKKHTGYTPELFRNNFK